MSDNLNKSLDDIIGAKPRANRRSSSGRRKSTTAKTASAGVTKKSSAAAGARAKKDVTKLKDAAAEPSKKRRGRSSKVNEDDPFYQATKATISNMPVDINDSKIKQYLNKEFGNVKTVEGLYGKNGKPTGRFVVEFSVEGKALAAFNKLNGMPMDEGARILAVEIHSDPTKKSLASRFGAKPEPPKAPKAKAEPKVKATAKKASGRGERTKRTKRPALKTAEELDAEMDDYHNQNDAITA